jgi:type IV pilus assembly protein PilV
MEHSFKNNNGFTLIEFLVALVIISVGLLALLQSVNLSLAENMKTTFRNQALNLADERMSVEKSKPFDNISSTDSGNYNYDMKQMTVNNTFKNYSVTTIGKNLTSNTKSIEIDVVWKYKGERYVHKTSSMVSKYQ